MINNLFGKIAGIFGGQSRGSLSAFNLINYDGMTIADNNALISIYKYNTIVNRCINMIASAVSDLPIELSMNDQKEDMPDLIRQLESPSTHQDRRSFIRDIIVQYLIKETYVRVLSMGSGINSMSVIPFTKIMKYSKDKEGQYTLLDVNNEGRTERYQYDHDNNCYKSMYDSMYDNRIYRFYDRSPDNFYDAHSPLDSCYKEAYADLLGLEYNVKLLKSGCPSSIINLDTSKISDMYNAEELIKKNKQIEDKFSRAHGTPLVLNEIPIQNIKVGITPSEMNFIELISKLEQLILTAFQIPHQMVFMDASTFNNQSEASRSFYRNTVLPLACRVYLFISKITPSLSEKSIIVRPDSDMTPALTGENKEKSDMYISLLKAGVLTARQVNQMLGLVWEESEYIPEPSIPSADNTDNNDDNQYE